MKFQKKTIKEKLAYWSQNSRIFQAIVVILTIGIISFIDIASGHRISRTIRLRERQAEAVTKIMLFLEKFHIAKITGILLFSTLLFLMLRGMIDDYRSERKVKISDIILTLGCIFVLIIIIFFYKEGDIWRSEHKPVTNWRPNFGN